MVDKIRENNKQRKREQEEKLEQERLQKVEQQAIRMQNELDKQEAIRKAEDNARAAFHNDCQEDSSSYDTDEALEQAAVLKQDANVQEIAMSVVQIKRVRRTPVPLRLTKLSSMLLVQGKKRSMILLKVLLTQL